MAWPRQRKIGAFLAILAVGAGSIAISFATVGGGGWDTPLSAAIYRFYTIVPAFAALAAKGALAREPILEPFRLRLKPNRWWLFAWLLPVALVALTWVIGGAFPGVELSLDIDTFLDHFRGRGGDPEAFARFEEEVRASMADGGIHPVLRMVLQGMVAGVTLNAVTALGEELGFRGFLASELRGELLRKAVFIGIVWGLWHAPIVVQGFAYPDHPISGVFWMTAWCIVVSAILLVIREKSGSIFAVGVCYGTLHSLREIPLLATRGGDDVTVGLTGAAGILAAAVLLGLLLYGSASRSADPPVA